MQRYAIYTDHKAWYFAISPCIDFDRFPGVPKLRRRNAKSETPKMRNSGAKRPIFNLI